MHVRSATVYDVDALLDLRAVMFDAIDVHSAGHWQGPCRQILLDGLASGDLIATIAETNDGTVVASAVAAIHRWLPSPSNPSGLKGYVGSMVTRQAWRGRGMGRRVGDHLVAALAARGVTEIELHATEASEDLYESLGLANSPTGPGPTLHAEAD